MTVQYARSDDRAVYRACIFVERRVRIGRLEEFLCVVCTFVSCGAVVDCQRQPERLFVAFPFALLRQQNLRGVVVPDINVYRLHSLRRMFFSSTIHTVS